MVAGSLRRGRGLAGSRVGRRGMGAAGKTAGWAAERAAGIAARGWERRTSHRRGGAGFWSGATRSREPFEEPQFTGPVLFGPGRFRVGGPGDGAIGEPGSSRQARVGGCGRPPSQLKKASAGRAGRGDPPRAGNSELADVGQIGGYDGACWRLEDSAGGQQYSMEVKARKVSEALVSYPASPLMARSEVDELGTAGTVERDVAWSWCCGQRCHRGIEGHR